MGIDTAPTTACSALEDDLSTHIQSQFSARIALASGINPSDIYSTRGERTALFSGISTPWVRNTQHWSQLGAQPVDLTGIAAWNEPNDGYSSQYQKLGVLISPRHILMANHWHPHNGAIIVFVTSDNTLVYRTLIAYQSAVGDIGIGLLDSDVPDDVTYYPLISSTDLTPRTHRYVGDDARRALDIPLLTFNQDSRAFVRKITALSTGLIHEWYFSPSLFADYSGFIRSGDSGSASITIIDGRPVALMTHLGPSSAGYAGAYIPEINAAMTILGGGYQVTEYDISCFMTYTLNNIPEFNNDASFITTLQQDPNLVLGTYSATDLDGGSVLTYSLVDLESDAHPEIDINPLDYFSVDPASGDIRQIADPDPALGHNLTLTARVTDDHSQSPGSSTVETPIVIDYPRLQGALFQDNSIYLVYDELLDEAFIPDESDFSIVTNSIPNPVLQVDIVGRQVKLTMTDTIQDTDTTTLTYVPSTVPIRNVLGMYASDISTPLSTLFSEGGSLDTTFNTGSGANDDVFAVQFTSDDKIWIGGEFTEYDGITRNHIARLNSDGSLDTTFDPMGGFTGSAIYTIYQYPDGSILAGGYFSEYQGVSQQNLVRLSPDGTLDATFIPPNISDYLSDVRTISVGIDDKITLGGFIAYSVNYPSLSLLRLNADGSLDATFDPTGVLQSTAFEQELVMKTIILSDGKTLVGGQYTQEGIHPDTIGYLGITRHDIDGSVDDTFNVVGSGVSRGITLVGYIGCTCIESMVLLDDGKIMIGGNFSHYNDISVNHLARLNADGSLDTTFQSQLPPETNGSQTRVTDILVQPDGKLLITGHFDSYDSHVLAGIARLYPDGSLDTTFVPVLGGGGGYPHGSIMGILSDNNLIIGGGFSSVNSIPRNNLALIHIGSSVTDITSPIVDEVTSSNIDGTLGLGQTLSLQIHFSEPVIVNGIPELLLSVLPQDRPAVYTSGSGSSILTFSYTVLADDESSDIDYVDEDALTLPVGASITDATGNPATLILPISVFNTEHNIAIDGVVPALQTVITLGSTLTLQYSDFLDTTSIPSVSDFALSDGTAIDDISVNGADVILTLATRPSQGTLTLTYTPSINALRDEADNLVSSFINEPVTDVTPASTTIPTQSSGGGGGGGSAGKKKTATTTKTSTNTVFDLDAFLAVTFKTDTPATRSDTVALGFFLHGGLLSADYVCKNRHTDTTDGVPAGTCQLAEKAQDAGLISPINTQFKPTNTVSRIEAYSIMMKSVCIHPETTAENWIAEVIKQAMQFGFTVRNLETFQPDRPLTVSEMHAVARQVDNYKKLHADTCNTNV